MVSSPAMVPRMSGSSAWSIADALHRSGGALAFAYHQRDVVSGGRDPGRTWLHHIRSLDRADRPSSPHPAMIIAGSGLVPRDLAEHAYGELGDPTNLQLLASEFAVRFGRPSSNALGFETGDWPALSSALAGLSIAARRALRMDLVELGLLSSADVEPEVAEHVTAAPWVSWMSTASASTPPPAHSAGRCSGVDRGRSRTQRSPQQVGDRAP